ncbi:MAG: hypothetical protein ABFC71_10005 [Methanoregula sp.]|jgi:hypothetical protein
MHITEVIRGWLGWCPQGSHPKTHTFAAPEYEGMAKTPAPRGPAAGSADNPLPAEHRPEYQTNLLLIVLFLAGLYSAAHINLLIPFSLLSAILVYFDAENIHAGQKFKEVSLLGEVATWRPIVWAVAVMVGSFFLLALYLFCRREIYTANN